jgi:hypothetical protein
MATYASDTGGGKDFDPVPEGSHLAVCDMFVDLGMQDGHFGAKHKIYLRWQIPALRLSYEKDGEKIEGPMSIGATYTLSLSEKSNLRPILQAWRGRAFTPEELKNFDVTTVLGAPCMITVTHEPKKDGGVYANVASVAKLPSGIPAPTLEGEAILYDADNMGTFEKLRPWLQEKIKAQIVPSDLPEERGGGGGSYNMADELLDDDVPFVSCDPALERRVR